MAVGKRQLPILSDRPLAKAGLKSESTLNPRGPGVFEDAMTEYHALREKPEG